MNSIQRTQSSGVDMQVLSTASHQEYFFNVMPDYDEDRVYASDIKKVIQWYNLLNRNGYTDFSEEETDGDEQE